MATIEHDLAMELIAKDGYYLNDPRVQRIVEYTNGWGGKSYGVTWQGENRDRYRESEFVIKPRVIWDDQWPAHYRCPHCGAVSFNANDIAHDYCGQCKQWKDDAP